MGSRDTKSSLKGKTIALPDIYYARLINKTFKLRASFFAYKFKANTSLGEPPYNDLYYTRTKVGLSLGVQQNFFILKIGPHILPSTCSEFMIAFNTIVFQHLGPFGDFLLKKALNITSMLV